MKKVIVRIFDILLVGWIVYFIICYGNILCHNLTDADYPAWNLLAQMILNSPTQ